MVDFKGLFTRRQPPAAPQAESSVRNNIFSTGSDSTTSRFDLLKRQQLALSRTFTRGVDNFVPVDAAGVPITGNADYAMDSAYPDLTQAKLMNSRSGYLPIAQLEWFANQGFIGWQMCGVLSQNWLIDKACGVPAQDAIRKGYDITLNDGTKLDPKILNAIRLSDKKMGINGKLKSFIKKGRIFGIRHALFIIDGIDYEAPFNPDGIRPGSYRGISQIDPYWLAPELNMNAAANPASPEFYEPTWWRVNGKRVHRSHFIIMRNSDDVVDILKPAYYYGGIPIPQKIFERVYASERTANESPLLLLSKRLTVLKTDTTKIFGPDVEGEGFNSQMERHAALRNNFGLSVFGSEDEVQQFETSLTELNETIMTQYALVAAAANVPVTKLLGTPPKGMDATGEYDEASYHEEVESIQEEIATPFLERHHVCLMRSYIAPKFAMAPVDTEVNWKPLDSYTTKELAEINKVKADTASAYVTAGAVDGYDVRQALINDPDSGFNGLDPIVPGGPGDREAQQEAQAALEQPVTAKPARADAQDGFGPAAGVMYQAGDKFLLMKRRPDAIYGDTWAFPAGTIEAGEGPADAADREFLEETGHSLENPLHLVTQIGSFSLFRVYGEEFVPMLCPEHTSYVWASVKELPSPLHPGVAEQIKLAITGLPV